jgi:hypothetical protein
MSVPAPELTAIPTAVDQTVKLTFIGHSTFLIETPAGVTIATDYNGYISAACGAAHCHHEPRSPHALYADP